MIAVPRLAKYGEHIDDHQIQVAEVLDQEGYLKCVINMDDLLTAINLLKNGDVALKKYNKPSQVVEIIKQFIQNN